MFLESQGDFIEQLPVDEREGFKGLLDLEAEGDGVWHHGLDDVMVKVADNAAVLFRVKAAGSLKAGGCWPKRMYTMPNSLFCAEFKLDFHGWKTNQFNIYPCTKKSCNGFYNSMAKL